MRHFRPLISVIMSLVMLSLNAGNNEIVTRQSVTGLSGSDIDFPSYMWVISQKPLPGDQPLNDSLFNAIAGQTIFRVDRTELNLNDPFLTELTTKAIPMANANGLVLLGFELRGAASPEGPYANNVRLARGRAAALRDFLTERLDTIAGYELNTSTVAEDYPHLLWLLERDGDWAAQPLRRIIDDCGLDHPDKIKERLQRYDSGELWKRLLKQYYPELRSARIVLYFKRLPLKPQDLPSLDVKAQAPEVNNFDAPQRLLIPWILQRRHVLSISTNVLYDAFWMPGFGWAPMPNIALEYYPKKSNFTARAAFMFPYYHKWSRQKFFQIRDYHLEARYYFNPGDFHTGWYLGAYINATKYGIGLGKTKGWQGEGMGGAIKAGYSLPLGRGRWRLDFHLAAGAWMSLYDPYVYGNPVSGEEDGDYYYDWTQGAATFNKRNNRLWWFGPTEVGITLTYDLLYRRIFKPGVSMRGKEVVIW